MREARVALALIGASLLLAAFLVSARTAVDEPTHLTAATAVVCGAHWRMEDGTLRVEAPRWVAQLPSLEGAEQGGPAGWTCERSRHVEHTAPYTPLAYLPQMAVLGIARVFEATPLMALLWARLLGAACVIAASAFLLLRAGDRAPLVASLVAMPGVAASLGSVSADGALLIATALLLATVVGAQDEAQSRPPHGYGRVAWLAWAVLLIGSSRVVYLPLVFLVLLLPPATTPRSVRFGLAALGLLAWLAWGRLVAPQLQAFAVAIQVDLAGNARRALTDPFDAIGFIARELIGSGAWWYTFVGVVGSEGQKLQAWVYVVVVVALFAAVASVRQPSRLPRPTLVLIGAGAVIGLVFLAYGVALRRGDVAINIVQGRHLLAPLLCIALALPPVPGLPERARKVAGAVALVLLAVVVLLYWLVAAS